MKKRVDVVQVLKRVILTCIRRNVASYIGAPERAVKLIQLKSMLLDAKTWDLFPFKPVDDRNFNKRTSRYQTLMLGSLKDIKSAAVEFIRKFEIRSDTNDKDSLFGSRMWASSSLDSGYVFIRFRVYSNGVELEESKSEVHSFESAMSLVYEKFVDEFVTEDVFNDPYIQDEFEKLLKGKPTVWSEPLEIRG